MEYEQQFPAENNTTQPVAPKGHEEGVASMDTTLSSLMSRLGTGDTFTGKNASLDVLIAALNDPVWQKRIEAARKLGEVEERDVHQIVQLLTSSMQLDHNPMVRAAAARVLGQHYPQVPEESLVRALEDNDDDVRTVAAQALKAWGTKLSQQTCNALIATFFSNEDEYTRAAVITTLGEAGDAISLNVFESALKDDSWIVREASALAMGKQGIRANTDALRDLLGDSSASVCRAAAYALKRIAELFERLRSEGLSEEATNKSQENASTPTRIEYKSYDSSQEDSEQRTLIKRSDWQLEPSDVRKHYPIVLQAFDDVYLDIPILEALIKKRVSYSEIEAYLGVLRRAEYIRSLLTSEKLTVNRTFLYNNPSLFRDYLPGNPERHAFKRLVEQGTIIPFLFNETSPLDVPPWIHAYPEGFAAWRQLCEEVKVSCLRLSWDDGTNQELIQQLLSFRFHQFAISVEERSVEKFAQSFAVPPEQTRDLGARLGELADKSKWYFRNHDQRHVNRTFLYEQFITEGSPNLRQYDGQKPFAAVIKQLLDLFYNGNLADALGGHLLTPVGAPTRLVLQEWDQIPKELPSVSAADLIEMLRRDTFQIIQGVLEHSSLSSLALLSLSDVLLLREQESAWRSYIQAMQALLTRPLNFYQLAPDVVLAYDALMQQATKLLERRSFQQGIALWKPGVEVRISIGGESIVTDWNENGVITNAPRSSQDIAAMLRRIKVGNGGEALCSVRLTIKDGGQGQSRATLATSFDILRVKLQDARKQWEEVVRKLGERLQSQEELKGVPTSTLDLQEQPASGRGGF